MRTSTLARTGSLLVASVLLVSAGATLPAAADTQVTATEGVNIRSRPSTTATVVGGLYRGQTVTAVKRTSTWTTIRFSGSTAYIASRYLQTGARLPAPVRLTSNSSKVTTTALNLRSGAGLSYRVLRVLVDGTRVTLTGAFSRGFAEVTVAGARGWVSNQYLASSASALPAVTGTRVATADLDVRTSSGASYSVVSEVKKGTRLSVTGAVQNGRAQIIHRRAVRWVTARYLSAQDVNSPSTPHAPRVTGARYATTELLIRSSSGTRFTVIDEVPRGTRLNITGVRQNGRSQIVYQGAARWVTTRYLSKRATSAPATPSYAVEKGLTAHAIAVHRAALEAFPAVRTYYGYRNDPSSDHYRGNAIDLMIPRYGTAEGRAYGTRIARWAIANQRRLHITYIIWDQRIWNVSRAGDGWRWMADRGGDSANHKDHVHISVR